MKDMTCVCDFDEYNWPSMDKDCPIHHQRKTLVEWWHTLVGWVKSA